MDAFAMLQLIERLHDSKYQIKETAYQTARQFIQQNPTAMFDRKNMHGHFSASAFAWQDQSIWFIKHPYLHTILLPAGHVELGETPLMTAQREYREETGFATHPINDSLNGLRDLNIISIPANPLKNEGAHFHVDLRYELAISSQQRAQAELPSFLIDRCEAPCEFHKYFDQRK